MICCTIEIETVKQKGSHVRQFHTYNQAVYYLYNELPKTPRLVQDPQAKIEQNKRIMQVGVRKFPSKKVCAAPLNGSRRTETKLNKLRVTS